MQVKKIILLVRPEKDKIIPRILSIYRLCRFLINILLIWLYPIISSLL